MMDYLSLAISMLNFFVKQLMENIWVNIIKGNIKTTMIVVCMWFIWWERNKCKHKNNTMNYKRVITRIKNKIVFMCKANLFNFKHFKFFELSANDVGFLLLFLNLAWILMFLRRNPLITLLKIIVIIWSVTMVGVMLVFLRTLMEIFYWLLHLILLNALLLRLN